MFLAWVKASPRFPAQNHRQRLRPVRRDRLPPRRVVRAGKLLNALCEALALARGLSLSGLFAKVLSRCHRQVSDSQTTAAASLDSGSDRAFTASDSSLTSALLSLS